MTSLREAGRQRSGGAALTSWALVRRRCASDAGPCRDREAAFVLEEPSVDRVDGKAIECYPSAALYRFGFLRAELKNAKTDPGVRRRLLAEISRRAPWLSIDELTRERLVQVGDSFDALIAALVARAAEVGMTDRPPPELAQIASVEGWIHLPVSDALGSLARGH